MRIVGAALARLGCGFWPSVLTNGPVINGLVSGQARQARVDRFQKEAEADFGALMGTGPFIKAFKGGADVVIAGRACDTAIYASYAIHKGFDAGLAFHMSKIIECGAQCAVPIGTSDCILGTMRADHFELEPMNPIMKLTPVSVAAHMMYEQPDPYSFYEPEGLVDLEQSRIEQVADNRVRVYGSKLHHADRPSIKLEGVTLRGYRTITVAGLNDPLLMQNLEDVKARVRDGVARLARGTLQPESYQLRFICYGQGGIMGRPEQHVPLSDVTVP